MYRNGADITSILATYFNLPYILSSSTLFGYFFNALLLLSGIFLFIKPINKITAILFAFLYLIQFVVINIQLHHNIAYQLIFVVMLFSFCTNKNENFSILWQCVRYYCCLCYSIAFFQKIRFGVVTDFNAGYIFFQKNAIEYIYHNNTSTAAIYKWLMQYPTLINIGTLFIFCLEGFFIIGFFTKKFDKALMLCATIIFVAIYFFMDVFFIEMYIAVLLSLLSTKNWSYFSEKIKRIIH